MSQTGYLILAIALIVALGVLALVLFLAYRRTPIPKGCEDIKADDGKCLSCQESSCPFSKKKEGE